MFSRSILKNFLVAATVLMATLATAATAVPVDQAAPASAGTIHTYLMPDLSLKTVFTSATVLPPTALIGTKTCRCSCGVPCTSDADCGGNVCGVGITCCAKGAETKWLPRAGQSSRTVELPALNRSCN